MSLILGLYILTRLLLFWRFPAYWDESFYAVQAQTGLDFPATRFSELADGKGPLFEWFAILFVGGGISPLSAVRLVSFLAGFSTMGTTALIARRLAGRTAAIVAGGLYVALPYFLVYDVHGFVDPLLAALATGALLLQIQQAENARLDRAFGLGLVLGAAVLTRELGILAILLLPFSLLCFDFAGPQRVARFGRWVGCTAVSLVLAGLCHSVLYLSPTYYQVAQIQKTTALGIQSRSISAALGDPFSYVSTIWPDVRGAFAGYIGLPLLAVVLGVILVSLRQRRKLPLLVTLWALAPIAAVMMITQFGYPRYFLTAIGPLTALAAAGLVWFVRWLPTRISRIGRAGATGLAALTLVLPLILDANVLAAPGTAKYPGEDDYEFAGGWASGTGLNVIGNALTRLAGPGPGQTIVAGVYFTPWNLAVRFNHPLRISLGPLPYQDAAVATWRGRKLYFYPYGNPAAANPQFVYQNSSFGTPSWLNLSDYHLVASYQRPRGGIVHGAPQPLDRIELYERN